jgi:predicted MFS family arabinose efflux permease
MVASVVLMLPLLRRMVQRKTESHVLPWAYGLIGLAFLFLSHGSTLVWTAVFLAAYFLSFNLLEAAMPALVARATTGGGRGRKMGLYSTFQFLGAFAGGAGGGVLLATVGGPVALTIAGIACLAWGLLAAWLSKRLFLTSRPDGLC